MQKTLVEKIKKNIYLLRFNDNEVKYFEGLWYIPEGITYNAYVATLPEGVVLFDGWKHVYGELYIETLRQVVDLSDVKHVVVHHMEPDHSGSLKFLLDKVENITVYGHSIANSLIQAFYGKTVKFKPVNDGEKLALGEDHVLYFIHTPWLHWPDTIISYLDSEKVLFTCDIFGSYGIPSRVFYEDLPSDEKAVFKWFTQKYFANVIGHHVDWVPKNLDKLSKLNLNVELIATGHGPLYRELNYILTLYKQLGAKHVSKNKTVIVYTSMYKFVEEAVEIVIDELRKHGLVPRVYKFTDMHRDHESDIVGDLFDSENIILATSTYDADVYPLAKYIVELIKAKIPSNKKVLVLTVHGWGPIAGKKLTESLLEKKLQVIGSIEIKGSPRKEEAKIREEVNKLIAQ